MKIEFKNREPETASLIMMPNCLQYATALFGALRAGLVVVNINPLYTARELEHQLKDAEVRTLVVMECLPPRGTDALVGKLCVCPPPGDADTAIDVPNRSSHPVRRCQCE